MISCVVKYVFSALVGLLVCLCPCDDLPAQGPKKQGEAADPRYSLPESVLNKPFRFAQELIPLDRPEVRCRIRSELNLLLIDARAVLTVWLTEESRRAWILDEVFQKEGIPNEFVLLAPIVSRMKRPGWKGSDGGIWALEKPCSSEQGVAMSSDDWHDDKMDSELCTKCFATQIKELRKELGDRGWLLTVAAYLSSKQTVKELKQKWNAESFWDLPPVDNAETLIPRWIALGIINSHRAAYGLKLKAPEPLVFDQVTGVVLAKDLPVAEVARMTGVPPRVILELNPKIKPSTGMFGAKAGGKPYVHNIATPRGKGQALMEQLKKDGFLAQEAKQ